MQFEGPSVLVLPRFVVELRPRALELRGLEPRESAEKPPRMFHAVAGQFAAELAVGRHGHLGQADGQEPRSGASLGAGLRKKVKLNQGN
jgi:hypothetical protein